MWKDCNLRCLIIVPLNPSPSNDVGSADGACVYRNDRGTVKLWCCRVGGHLRVGVAKKGIVENMRVQLSLEGWGTFGGELGGIWGREGALLMEEWGTVRRPSWSIEAPWGDSYLRGYCALHWLASVDAGWWRKDFPSPLSCSAKQATVTPSWEVTPVPRSSWGTLNT